MRGTRDDARAQEVGARARCGCLCGAALGSFERLHAFAVCHGRVGVSLSSFRSQMCLPMLQRAPVATLTPSAPNLWCRYMQSEKTIDYKPCEAPRPHRTHTQGTQRRSRLIWTPTCSYCWRRSWMRCSNATCSELLCGTCERDGTRGLSKVARRTCPLHPMPRLPCERGHLTPLYFSSRHTGDACLVCERRVCMTCFWNNNLGNLGGAAADYLCDSCRTSTAQ